MALGQHIENEVGLAVCNNESAVTALYGCIQTNTNYILSMGNGAVFWNTKSGFKVAAG